MKGIEMKKIIFLWLSFVSLPMVASEQDKTDKFQENDLIEITFGSKKNLKGFIAGTALEAWQASAYNDGKNTPFCAKIVKNKSCVGEYIAEIVPPFAWRQATLHSSKGKETQIYNNYLRLGSYDRLEDIYCIDTENNEQCFAHKSWLKIYKKSE